MSFHCIGSGKVEFKIFWTKSFYFFKDFQNTDIKSLGPGNKSFNMSKGDPYFYPISKSEVPYKRKILMM